MQIVRFVILSVFLFIAALTDSKKGRISNRLIGMGFLIIIVLTYTTSGVYGVLHILWNGVLPVIIFYPLFLTQTLGAGDIKLFSVMSSYMGIRLTIISCIAAFVMVSAYVIALKCIQRKNILHITLAPWLLAAFLIVLAVM